ncbi:aromatic-ring-hydroxylating dioxygenase subunit beta [Sphingobium sp. H39-3-25]|mgnify:CR=1 FL=1|uniref:aromatic-ring-hydroxylating dioxygenase subunit beta n=1 Tax=Sphingomonadales TaxID=204457 RepID=UPI00082A2C4A|nr:MULTISPECIES: aromatic-ring-hydroxylating dioxygenase subunit beta [Sphingomonadaceae]MDF0488853.1 aromatic-ring-hydroxylating dioxygenase subunit beta [Sphingomonas pollutisoli]MDF0546264.1 aromatic-ring-hydroxylating dioxygenase subunit beta [Sphingobium arseniciresistens]
MITDTNLRLEVIDLFARYVACLDSGNYDAWPDFFTQDCHYRVVPRENYDAGLPLSTLSLHGVPMLRDRLYGVESTLFHAPYYQRHIIGPTLIKEQGDDGLLTETNYLVVRTKRDMPSEIFNTGRYVDRIVITPQGLRFAEKACVFDSELIPNSLIYPI